MLYKVQKEEAEVINKVISNKHYKDILAHNKEMKDIEGCERCRISEPFCSWVK